MKIINAHLHFIEIEKLMLKKERFLRLLESIPSFKNIQETISLISVEDVLRQMDEAGITTSVIFACYAPIIYASNEFVSQLCKKSPDRFIGFASIDPRSNNAPKVLEKAVKDLGLKGLKLHPPLQNFYPQDKKLWPTYKKAAQLNIPVVFHTGSTPFGALVKLEQANPILLDEVAAAFPELKIILTHLGTLWHNEAFMVAEKNPNVFLDTSAYPYEIKNLLTKELISRIGEDKFIFGTDFPMPYEGKIHRMKDFVETINNLDLSGETKEKIFYKNFEKLLTCEQNDVLK